MTQGGGQFRARLVARQRVTGNRPADQRGNGRGQVRAHGLRRRRRLAQVFHHGVRGRFDLERQPPRSHLIQHHAHGVEVGATIHGFAQDVFGRHVGKRAQHGSRLGAEVAFQNFRQAKIGDEGANGRLFGALGSFQRL